MPAQVTLFATRGDSIGEEYVFTGTMSLVLGRASDCSMRITDDLTVSRHHCRLDIHAPEAWVEDLGSLNGTYVNGVSIGRRDRGPPGEEVASPKAPRRRLADGDELRIGDSVFEVVVDGMAWAEIERKRGWCSAGA